MKTVGLLFHVAQELHRTDKSNSGPWIENCSICAYRELREGPGAENKGLRIVPATCFDVPLPGLSQPSSLDLGEKNKN